MIVEKIDDSRVCVDDDYEEDEKESEDSLYVGYGSLAETSVLFTITPIPRNSGWVSILNRSRRSENENHPMQRKISYSPRNICNPWRCIL